MKENKQILNSSLANIKLANNPDIVKFESRAPLNDVFNNVVINDSKDIVKNRFDDKLEVEFLTYEELIENKKQVSFEELLDWQKDLFPKSTIPFIGNIYSCVNSFVVIIYEDTTENIKIVYKINANTKTIYIPINELICKSFSCWNYITKSYQEYAKLPICRHDKVAIRIIEDRVDYTTTTSGVIYQNSHIKTGRLGERLIQDEVKYEKGQIVSIGQGMYGIESGTLIPMQYNLGDIVYIGYFAGAEIDIDAKNYKIVRELDIICKL
jgi:co-chaperonin GroES (HSP10)